ncbi:hypothetical protein CBS101457_006145 [Exobasidium rhododendri]|nr:hypothetical protein CBS101457_006145 [Exobasidium rhododendri]
MADYTASTADETLTIAIRLIIPASEKTLPYPSATSKSSFSLPLDSTSEDRDDEDSNAAPPRLLSLLISSLQVSLDCSYTAPRLGILAGTATHQTDASTSNNYLIPTTLERDAAYQSVPLQGNSSNGEVTQMFTNSWNGNATPSEPVEKKGGKVDARKRKVSHNERTVKNGGEIWYKEDKGEAKWITEWRCKLPIMFMRTRHPTPALVLTASMTLRLQSSQLTRLDPTLAPSPSTSASESLYLHDLLNPLSEGPSYPDESAAERAARTNASLAKLPLGKLPSSILGSKLVTPARNAKEVGQIILSKTRKMATENGDMGDKRDTGRFNISMGERRNLTNQGLMAFQVDLDGEINTLSDDQVRGLGEETVVLQRSARKVLDVQSAILVRMRTITVPGFQADDDEGRGDTLLPTLLLCVEVENPMNSGMRFAMDEVDVAISTPASLALSSGSNGGQSIDISMHRIGNHAEPLLLEQGDQHNLLYQMAFDCPVSGSDKDDKVLNALHETSRNVNIQLLGRPVLMRGKKGAIESFTPTEKFTSTWTCTLDLAAPMKMAAMQRVMHNGAGGDRFGGQRLKDPQQQRGRVASPLTIAPHSSIASAMYTNSLPLPASPFSALPRTPNEIQSGNSSLTVQTSPSQMISRRRSSMRLASDAASSTTARNETSISLHRSEIERRDISSPSFPALSSALANQSILARARINRSSTMASGRAEESRQLLNGKGESEAKHRSVSDNTVTSTRRQGYPPALQRPVVDWEGREDELGRDALLPLGDKRSNATIQRLLYNSAQEQGLLIDVIAAVTTDDHDASLPTSTSTSTGKKRFVSVEVQIENRSERTRTIILSWRLPPVRASDSGWDSILLEFDDVQVGPLQRGDSDVVSLKIALTRPGVQQLPPLAIYDTLSGTERILQGMQSVMTI